MSFIGKLLIVIQIVLSVMFAALATTVFTYHQSWRNVAEQRQQSLDAARREAETREADLNKQVTDLRGQLDAEKSRADGAVTEVRNLRDERDSLVRSVESTTADLNRQTALAEINASEAGFRVKEAMEQREQNRLLHERLDESKMTIIDLRNQNFNLQAETTALKDKYNSLLEKSAFLERVVRLNNLETDPEVYAKRQNPPPAVEGVVLETELASNGTVSLVKVSLGTDDGLMEGHELDIYRLGEGNGSQGPKYLGKIKIRYLTSDTAVGTVVMKAKNGIIQKGDNVASNL